MNHYDNQETITTLYEKYAALRHDLEKRGNALIDRINTACDDIAISDDELNEMSVQLEVIANKTYTVADICDCLKQAISLLDELIVME